MSIIKSKTVHGVRVTFEESMGLFGGMTYTLVVDGRVLQVSSDRDYIEREFDRY